MQRRFWVAADMGGRSNGSIGFLSGVKYPFVNLRKRKAGNLFTFKVNPFPA